MERAARPGAAGKLKMQTDNHQLQEARKELGAVPFRGNVKLAVDELSKTQGSWNDQNKKEAAAIFKVSLEGIYASVANGQFPMGLTKSICESLWFMRSFNSNPQGADLFAGSNICPLAKIVLAWETSGDAAFYAADLLSSMLLNCSQEKCTVVCTLLEERYGLAGHLLAACDRAVGSSGAVQHPKNMSPCVYIGCAGLFLTLQYTRHTRNQPAGDRIYDDLRRAACFYGRNKTNTVDMRRAFRDCTGVLGGVWYNRIERLAPDRVIREVVLYKEFVDGIAGTVGDMRLYLQQIVKNITNLPGFSVIQAAMQEIADANANRLLAEEAACPQPRARRRKARRAARTPPSKPYLDLSDEEADADAGPTIFTTEECVFCMDAEPEVLFARCGHRVCCEGCAGRIRTAGGPHAACPYCRTPL